MLNAEQNKKTAGPTVGVDAHIDPAVHSVFMEICGEFATSRRADVGIGPYNHTRKCVRIRRKFPKKFTAFRRAEQSPAPYQVLGKFVLPLKF